MSVDLETRMHEDRAMRDSALSILKADYAHLKADYRERGLADRAMDRMRDGAEELYNEFQHNADKAPGGEAGVIAALVTAIGLWFARNPILSFFGLHTGDEDDNVERDEYDDEYDDDYEDEDRRGIFRW